MLYIGNCEKIVKYSYDTSKFLKKNIIIINNNKNLINIFSLSKINNFNINNLKSFRKILIKFLNQIKLAYVSIEVGNSLKSNNLFNYQRTKKKIPILKDVISHYNNFIDISKTLGSKNNSVIDTIRIYGLFSATGTIQRSSNIYSTKVVNNGLFFYTDLVNLHKYVKDNFQTPFGDLLNSKVLSGLVSDVSNFALPNTKLMRSQSPISTFSSLHTLLEPSTTTFSSLHTLLEPSTTTFSSLHTLLEPSTTTFSSLHTLLEPSTTTFSSLHTLLEPSTTTFSSLHTLLEPSTTTFSSLHTLLEPSTTTFSSLHTLLEPSTTTFSSLHTLLEPSTTTFSSLHTLLEPSTTTFSSLHTLLEPSTTTFSSLHTLLEPSTTTFSSLHTLLEPSSTLSKFNSETLNLKILNEIFSKTKNIVNPAVAANVATTDGQLSFFNNKIKFQDRSYIFNNYFKGTEKALYDFGIVKKNSFIYSTSIKNLVKYDNLNVKKYDNNFSKNLLQYEKLSNNIISKIHNNSKISENLDWMRNTSTNFMKLKLKKDIKKFVADSNDLFDYNRTLLSPIQKPHILLPANNKLTVKRNPLGPPQLSTMQNQVENPRFQNYGQEEESFKLTNINDMKIKQTNGSEKLIKKTKTIDDIFSANNIDDNIGKSTNPKLISLTYA